MKNKTMNWFFLSLVLSHVLILLVISIFQNYITLGIVSSLLISQGLILIPSVIFLFLSKTKLKEVFKFRKIHISTVFMTILYAYLIMPLISVVNGISMLFTENIVMGMTGELVKLPFALVFLLIAILGPINEELVLRGIIYEGYKKKNGAFWALIISSIMFGLMHMNLNQALYAMVVGIMLILIREATGSLLAPIICHIVFNGHSTILVFITEKLGVMSEEVSGAVINDDNILIITICMMAIIATITTALALCVLAWIANKENHKKELLDIWVTKDQKENKIITIPLVVGILICISIMTINL